MADTSLIHSEILCFIQTSISSVPKNNIITSICGFYAVEDVTEAKNLSFRIAEGIKSTFSDIVIPRNVVRRAGDGRIKHDSDDILELWDIRNNRYIYYTCSCLNILGLYYPTSFI